VPDPESVEGSSYEDGSDEDESDDEGGKKAWKNRRRVYTVRAYTDYCPAGTLKDVMVSDHRYQEARCLPNVGS
jgi:hypothetical protein